MTQLNRSRQNEKVRMAILNAAFTLVGEIGYDKLTIEGIAKRAGAGKQTLYRWWSSKALVLLEALVENVQDELVFEDTGNVREDLLAQMRDDASDQREYRMFVQRFTDGGSIRSGSCG